ncbi:hypothetical protein X805_16540 [Sphaerotilus natans subsp. natans DSM 6575]|uniref:(S)-ureidoglycine aminohydrolase cupin domain-containing protein n=1 Tax=Sphaerotilus natans subsp. natans DSM 6575 TaxID=1286631 RepID=A0A059KMZ2_9BURK|nr:cupin domain-containing protein [Sphaerotilus natans]KDB52740.1 hypothetical protein X805_16540 [Sphaerotilus natans subsp. natans DSM 6575]SIR87387.1 hypothetical protein SAMN05421778_12041 [Sphaerotilus natans]
MTAPASVPHSTSFDAPAIVLIDNHPATAPAVDHPRADRRLSGCPRRETWTAFEAPQGDLSAGVWTCEPGHWRIVFPPHKDEYFFVLEGRLRLHDAARGTATEVRAGQGAVIPGGFEGSFEVIELVRKHFVVVERP